jgi:hypothetical protein
LAAYACVLGVAAMGLAGCGGGGSPPLNAPVSPSGLAPSDFPLNSPANTFEVPACDYPKKIAFPRWVPNSLPLPKGTYATRTLPTTQGYNRGLFVVPGSLRELATFVLDRWPKEGWVLGRGDAEPGEIDDQFTKPPAVGAFKAREQFCKPGYSLMLLVYIKDRTKVVFSSPSLSPSPSSSS